MATHDLTRADVAALTDHTLHAPSATVADVETLCDEARRLEVHAVCVSPSMVAPASAFLADSAIRVVSVIGFPSGAHRTEIKQTEARRALEDGAMELDMVINLGLGHAGEWSAVEHEIAAVRATAEGALLKVIIETATLDAEATVRACLAVERAGADFVKSSTGFHPAGGATARGIELIATIVGGRIGIKAAGGIRDADAALALLAAGATRLGVSRTAAVLAGLPA
jgi:deoxyribose-phosphate aldolase